MTLQSATLGRFWLGPQIAKGTAASTLYGWKANMVDVAPNQMTRNIGQLVGGSLLPGGSVKTAAWSAGAMVCPPSLDDYIGWLLYSFAGTVSTVDEGGGIYTHYFPSGADDTAPAKYLTARRSVPATSTLYEQMEDLVPYRLLFGFTPGEFATMRCEMVGRTPSEPDGSGWAYSAKNEDSVPIACKGHFELPDDTVLNTISGVTLDMTNVIPPLNQVLTVGNYYPYDFPVLARQITLTFACLWESKTLYESLYYSAGSWSPTQYSSSVDLEVQSTGVITGSDPYKLKFYGQTVDWTCEPIQLVGGNLVAMAMTGVVTDATSGLDWYLALTNGTTSYTWPTS